MIASYWRKPQSRSSSPALGFPGFRFQVPPSEMKPLTKPSHNSSNSCKIFYSTGTYMANTMNHRNGQIETQRRGKIVEKSSSFHGHFSAAAATKSGAEIRLLKTLQDLVPDRKHAGTSMVADIAPRQPPKLLVKVTTMGGLGPVQVVMMPEATVGDLVATAVKQYVKEGRRPFLPSNDPSHFDLHYSQFSLESLDREAKLGEIGSRNFFLCPRNCTGGTVEANGGATTSFDSCSKEAVKANKGGEFGCLSFMEFLP